jgi:hypothetical protein
MSTFESILSFGQAHVGLIWPEHSDRIEEIEFTTVAVLDGNYSKIKVCERPEL